MPRLPRKGCSRTVFFPRSFLRTVYINVALDVSLYNRAIANRQTAKLATIGLDYCSPIHCQYMTAVYGYLQSNSNC